MEETTNVFSDFTAANNEGKIDMFEEAHERMVAAEERVAELEEGLRDAIGVLATAYPIKASRALALAGKLSDLLNRATS